MLLEKRVRLLISQKKEIHNEIAHFGQVPYGSGIVGFVHRPKDIDACTEVEQIDPYDHVDDQPIL